MSWTCVLLTPTGQAERYLRRFTRSEGCSVTGGGHQAIIRVEAGPLVRDARGMIEPVRILADDPRWPTHCACGYAFTWGDHAVIDQEPTYTLPDGRAVSTHPMAEGERRAPIGAMWVVEWVPPGDEWAGPDGRCLMLRLPDGMDWMIDGPSRSGGKWTRTGEAPQITARPSIASPRYHGWLTDGVLSDDLEGRTYAP